MKRLSRIFIAACCGAALAPFLWTLFSSVKTPAELALVPPTLLPHHVTLANYAALFTQRPFLRYCVNSFTISAMASLICIACAALAAYRLARIRGRIRSTIRLSLLVIAFFPPIVFIFPVYELIHALGLLNHPWGLILPYAALNLPFAIWLLTGSFEQIPFELEEAAAIDGLTRLQTLVTVILPVAAPALITAGLLVFIFSWNEFMLALTLMNIESQKTVTLGIATLSGAFAEQIPYGQIAAGVIASSIPLIVLVALFQRRIVAGLTAGALK
jgi:ABC-type glycerol-3-phosphate transport system permease component